MTTNEQIIWTDEDMIETTIEYWGDDSILATDCEVVTGYDGGGDECLIVLHRPTGRTSDEAGDAGRWTSGRIAVRN